MRNLNFNYVISDFPVERYVNNDSSHQITEGVIVIKL